MKLSKQIILLCVLLNLLGCQGKDGESSASTKLSQATGSSSHIETPSNISKSVNAESGQPSVQAPRITNFILVTLESLVDGGNICQIHFAFNNRSNINFTSLWVNVSASDRNGYEAESQGIQQVRLPPQGKARGYYTYANINCNELSKVKLLPLGGTSLDLTEVSNSHIERTLASTVVFEGESKVQGVSLQGSYSGE